MTTYLGDKAVGIGTIKETKAVAGDVLHDETLVGNGNTEPLGVDRQVIATTNQVGNLATTLHAAIEAQAEAIAKTRNDFEIADQNIRADMNAEDSRLQTQITSQASQITTNKNDIDELGDDVAEIQAKIPESASGNNPLITKQQLLDEEMDIRADYNELVSELQTQITAQAGAIAGLENDKLDRNLDPLNAGKYLIVGDDGNVGLTASGGGGSGGISSVAHDSTLTGAGTDASPLGLSTTIKDEIADKAPKETVEALTEMVNDALVGSVKKSGDTMTGALNVPELNVQTSEGTLNLSITAGVATIATNNGLDIVSQTKFDTTPTTDDNTTWENALDTSLVRKAQVAKATADAISAHNTATNAHSNIRGVAGGLATLDNNAKVPMPQINDALLGNVSYQGLWNAAENVPFLADPSGDIQLPKGHYYITSVAGDRFGLHFDVGDWIISAGGYWTKVDNTDAVVAVNGRTGNVVLNANDVNAYNKTEIDDKFAETDAKIDEKIGQNELKNVFETIYPVGSIYIGTQSTCPMSIILPNSSWVLVSSGRALWTGDGSNANTTIEPGLPNIKGQMFGGLRCYNTYGSLKTMNNYDAAPVDGNYVSVAGIELDASVSSPIYGNSDTVQPPAYVVNVWRRTE